MQKLLEGTHRVEQEHLLLPSFDSKQNLRQLVALVVLQLKDCARHRDLRKGRRLHAEILKRDLLHTQICVGNTLISLYAKCGALAKAQQLADDLPVQDVVSWNCLIAGYAQCGRGREALRCFDRIRGDDRLSPNWVTFLCALKACGISGAADKGSEIHVEMARKGIVAENSMLSTALLDMYGKCGALAKAKEVFDELPVKNVVSWTALAAGYEQNGQAEKAIICFEEMQKKGIFPSAFTLSCILKACGSMKAVDKGAEIHELIKKKESLKGNTVLSTALIDMYAKSGALTKAREVFDELSPQDIITWNALIGGYCEHGPFEEALKCLELLNARKLLPDPTTFSCALKACGNLRAIENGQEIHSEIVRRSMLKQNCVLGTALVDMYAKCGAIAKAREVFDHLSARDIASWNALMGSYCQDGRGEKVLDCFEQMREEGFSPDVATFAFGLKACGILGAVEKGEEIYVEVVREGFLGAEAVLGSAAVDMYSRCGAYKKAHEVFDKLSVKNGVSWTALIAGYAHAGKHEMAFHLLSKMIAEDMEPNLVTFFVVLSACSYLGLVNEGQIYFEFLSTRYGMIPMLEHQTCMVGLMSRVGHFEEAAEIINKMPSIDHLPAWLALLGACRSFGNKKFGRLAFDHAIRLDSRSAVAYVCMRDIYVGCGMQEDADKLEAYLM